MALVPGFENDIFISYVQADNLDATSKKEGWVDQFHKYLSTKLIQHDEKIKIWRDGEDMDKSEVFDKSIAAAIEKSAIMICLYSQRYTKSKYCIKELEHFHKKAQSEKTGLHVGNRSRIIPIMISNVHYSKWPDKLSGTTSFKFHDAKNDQEYGDPLRVNTEGPFSEEMKNLRTALVRILEDFHQKNTINEKQEESVAPQTENKSFEDKHFTIYMGEVSDSLYDRRDGIIAELESKGYKIITGDPSSSEDKAHQKITKEAIEKAQLAVHILNDFPGRKINGAPDSRYIQKQVEIGLTTSTPQLIWVPTELDVSKIINKEHHAFLQGIEDRSLSPKNYEFVRGIEGELAKVLLDHSKQLEELAKQQSRQEAVNTETIKILLDTHIDDFKDAFDLKKTLSKHNIELIFNPEDGDPQENMKSLVNNINEAQKFIFLYGNEDNRDWVDIRVKSTMKKLMEYDRFSQDIFVYMTPPFKETGTIKVAQSPLVKVINSSDKEGVDASLINQFLEGLIAEKV